MTIPMQEAMPAPGGPRSTRIGSDRRRSGRLPGGHAEDFGQWTDLVSGLFVPLRSRPEGPGRFAGEVTGSRLDTSNLVHLSATAHTVERTADLIEADSPSARDETPGYFKITAQLAGSGHLVQGGRETVLRPGDLAMYDTTRPYTLSFDSRVEVLVFMVRKTDFGALAAVAEDLVATRFDPHHPMSSIIGQFLRSTVESTASADVPVTEALARRLNHHAVDMMATLVSSEVSDGGGARFAGLGLRGAEVAAEHLASDHGASDAAAIPATGPGPDSGVPRGRAARLHAVRAWILERVDDPELSPAVVARAHFMSLRSLHALFAESDWTVASWIRESRLLTARDLLESPRTAELTVSAIARRCGILDAAYFSRAFRKRFGCTPSYVHANSSAGDLGRGPAAWTAVSGSAR